MAEHSDRVWQDARVAKTYLTGVRRAIPLAAEQIDVVLRLVEARGLPVGRVLDLGCGDGFLAAPILDRWPESCADLVDFSETMLAAARERFAGRPKRASIVRADYSDPAWVDALARPRAYDVIVSGFSIHHQPDERKRTLYQELFDLLAPGGMFLNVEHVASATPWLEEQFNEYLIDAFHAYHGDAKSRAEIARELVRRDDKQANILALVERQCDWLRQIGFEDVDCYLKVFELAVFGGRKAAASDDG